MDLVYSLNQQACIESPDPMIQALGFQGLAHLCEADVIGKLTIYKLFSYNILISKLFLV